MAITLAQYHTYLDATHAAIAAGDSTTALTNARAARAVLMGLPTESELGVERIKLERDLDALITDLQKQAKASTRLGSVRIHRKNMTGCRS